GLKPLNSQPSRPEARHLTLRLPKLIILSTNFQENQYCKTLPILMSSCMPNNVNYRPTQRIFNQKMEEILEQRMRSRLRKP
ncbi:hypothetical protein L9F63_023809, partial [Diploptera punctata]